MFSSSGLTAGKMISKDMSDPALPWSIDPQHILTLQVSARDIDDFGHVNNVVYLTWMARAAWDHSKALGFDFEAYRARDCGFVVTRHEIDYRAACFEGDTVQVATWVSKNDQRLKLRRRFQMISETSQSVLATGMSEFATMKISTGKACRMPSDYATGYPVRDDAEAAFTR